MGSKPKKHIVEALVRNAEKHEARWTKGPNHPGYMFSLVEELGELATALQGKHEHPPELELLQLGGLIINWLQAMGVDADRMAYIESIDEIKHPTPYAPEIADANVLDLRLLCPHGFVGVTCAQCGKRLCNLCGLFFADGSYWCVDHPSLGMKDVLRAR